MKVLVATRSAHKLQEIRAILRDCSGIDLIDLTDAGVPELPEEAGIEAFETFEDNAVAKARYFAGRSDLPVLADDSGLEVDALGGAPGVHSKRFAPEGVGSPELDQDERNNGHLLAMLEGVDDEDRTARYVCVAALLLSPDADPITARGEAEGVILESRRGQGGFGYDPLFLDREFGVTFAELSADEKDARSHRGRAFRELANRMTWK